MEPPIRRQLRYTLGSLLAFIAGMAVMLAILLPFVRPQPIVNPSISFTQAHAGMTIRGPAPQSCMQCHSAVPK